LELTVPTGQAEELVFLAEILPGRLPHTWVALRTGQIDYHRACVIADGLAALDDELAGRVEAELIGAAVEDTTTLLRRRVSRAVKRADPDAAARRTRHARDRRRVELWDNCDDTCDLVGRHLNSVDAHAIGNRLSAAAQAMRADGDTRPLDHIRLDLFRDLLRGIPLPEATHHLITTPPTAEDTNDLDDAGPTGDGEADQRSGRRQVHDRHGGLHPADQTTDAEENGRENGRASGAARAAAEQTSARLAAQVERQIAHALADAADERLTGLYERARVEGRLDGMARIISQAADAMRDALDPLIDSWCRTTSHTTGPTDDRGRAPHGHNGYRPPAALQRLIQQRHITCVYPSCHRRSWRCDLDHTKPYDKGGRTCRCNMAPLCRAHHRVLKQHWQWKLIQLWPGLLIWMAPAGTWHIVLPQ
ncbi:MAG TPA: DUF222 domain-containing protein, partial [Streptosporangiaceae bacterium]